MDKTVRPRIIIKFGNNIAEDAAMKSFALTGSFFSSIVFP